MKLSQQMCLCLLSLDFFCRKSKMCFAIFVIHKSCVQVLVSENNFYPFGLLKVVGLQNRFGFIV